jgi:hypothetical protein
MTNVLYVELNDDGRGLPDSQLRQHPAQEVRRNLDQRLAQAVANFREIDQNPRWRQWLTNPDALSGRARQQLLNDAAARGDACASPRSSAVSSRRN